jgi:formimidoylglutamase
MAMKELSPSAYPVPTYKDPFDRRITSIIRRGRTAKDGWLNLLGVPFDGATLGRKGSSLAPNLIREALRFNSNFNAENGSRLADAKINDIGNVNFQSNDIEKVHDIIYNLVYKSLREKSLLVLLGGDNSISLPSILACSRRYHNVGLIVIDSHFDLRGRIAGKPTSGSSYGLALDSLGSRLDGRFVEIGIHGFLNSYDYQMKAERLGVSVFTPDDVARFGPTRTARRAFKIASEGADCVYLSLDLDAVRLSEVSGVSAPSPAGLSSREVFDIVYFVASRRITRCADIVETSPPLDPTGRSQIVAASALLYMAAGFELRRTLW